MNTNMMNERNIVMAEINDDELEAVVGGGLGIGKAIESGVDVIHRFLIWLWF